MHHHSVLVVIRSGYSLSLCIYCWYSEIYYIFLHLFFVCFFSRSFIFWILNSVYLISLLVDFLVMLKWSQMKTNMIQKSESMCTSSLLLLFLFSLPHMKWENNGQENKPETANNDCVLCALGILSYRVFHSFQRSKC